MEDIHIPCLIIQPLVENAIKHGINTSVLGGNIEIKVIFADNNLSITVEDVLNMHEDYPISESLPGENTAIKNITKRLEIIYGENGKFTFNHTDSGAVSTIIISNIKKGKHAKV